MINVLIVINYVLIYCESLSTEFIFHFKKKISKATKKINKISDALVIKHVKFVKFLLKVMCLSKTLNQINYCISIKIDCLAAELNNNNDETENEINSFNIQQLVNSMSSFF